MEIQSGHFSKHSSILLCLPSMEFAYKFCCLKFQNLDRYIIYLEEIYTMYIKVGDRDKI